MNQEDVKNLVGWLQAIFKESQETRGAVHELRRNVELLPEIRESVKRGTQDSADAERKIEETRNQLESRITKLEDTMNDIRGILRDINSKIDRLK